MEKTKQRRVLVCGDLHGNFKALKQVLDRSKFNYSEDKLILLGDLVDGHAQTKECVEELLKIKHLVFVLGNHDDWFLQHLNTGFRDEVWLQQGGANTLKSYGAKVKVGKSWDRPSLLDTSEMIIPASHQDFFNRAVLYHVEDDMLFVHGGFNPDLPIQDNEKQVLLWDRELIIRAQRAPIPRYKKIFVGHTTTQVFGNRPEIKDCMAPVTWNNLVCCDCGSGSGGRLALIDIDREKHFLSDIIEAPWK